MSKLITFVLFFAFSLSLWSQVVPPPATQIEVDTGSNRFKYVTPLTLKNWNGLGSATGAVTVAQLNSASNAIVNIDFNYTNFATMASGYGTFGGITVSNTASVSNLSVTGVGAANASLYDAAGTEYFQFLAPANINSNAVLRLPTNGVSPGVMVAQPNAYGTNDWQFVPLTAGQYVTYNGTAYVPSNLPAGGGSGTAGAQVTNVSLFTGTSTNLVIDLGLASTNHVNFIVGMLTNSHIVFSNAPLLRYPAFIKWQIDSNGNRTILSLRSTDGLIVTNGGPLTLTTNANGKDIWELYPDNFASNTVVDVGFDALAVGIAGGAFPMLQFRDTGGVLAGTTNYTWDSTNSRIGLKIAGARPNVDIDIGGNFPEIDLRGGTVSSTNRLTSTGMVTHASFTTIEVQSSGISRALLFTQDTFRPNVSDFTDSGTFLFHWKTNYASDFFAKETVTAPLANIRTNLGTMDVTTNLFALGTRITNGTRRIFVAASVQLSAAAAGTAKATLYVENGGSSTNRLSVSAGPLASLITVEALFLPVSPGSIYYFADETSGTGAAVAIVAETCSVTSF